MTTFTADSELRDVFGKFHEVTQIRDSSGNLIGTFTPASCDEDLLYARAAAHFDPAEMKRRKDSGQIGRTTAEVLAKLKQLP